MTALGGSSRTTLGTIGFVLEAHHTHKHTQNTHLRREHITDGRVRCLEDGHVEGNERDAGKKEDEEARRQKPRSTVASAAVPAEQRRSSPLGLSARVTQGVTANGLHLLKHEGPVDALCRVASIFSAAITAGQQRGNLRVPLALLSLLAIRGLVGEVGGPDCPHITLTAQPDDATISLGRASTTRMKSRKALSRRKAHLQREEAQHHWRQLE